MAVPSSGNSLSMLGIFSEKNENDYGAANIDGESNISLRGLSSNSFSDTSTGGNINLNANSTNKPDQSAPHSMSEFYGYDHDAAPAFSWGTPGSITTNAGTIYNVTSDDDSYGGEVTARSFVKLSHPSSGTINFQFTTMRINDIDGDTTNNTNTASLTYTGTLTSLEARIIFTSVDFQRTGGFSNGTSDSYRGTQKEIHSQTSHMSATSGTKHDINLPSSGQSADNNNNITRSYRTMSTTGNSSLGLEVQAEAPGGTFSYSSAEIQGDSSSEKIKIELRANGSSTVTLYERVGPFRLLADSFVDTTT